MTGDCTNMSELLMEYVYDELDGDSLAQVTAHLADCPGCTEALEDLHLTRRLLAQAPTVPPLNSPQMLRDIMEMAADEVSEFKQDNNDDVFSRPRTLDPAGRIASAPSFVDTLRAWLLKPAMATAVAASFALVLGIYLWQNTTDQRYSKYESLSDAPFLGPSTALEEAELSAAPTAIPSGHGAADFRTADERPMADADEYDNIGTGKGVARATKAGLATSGPPPINSADKLGFAPEPASPATPMPTEKEKMSSGWGNAMDDLLGGSASGGAAPAPQAADGYAESASKSASSPKNEPGNPASASQEAPQEVAAEDSDAFAEGMKAYGRGDCTRAIPLLQSVAEGDGTQYQIATALHHLARCEKRTGRCGAALTYYTRLVSNFASYSARPDAMFEAAACHRKLGRIDEARRILTDLMEYPAWKSRAATELDSLENI